MTDRNFHSGYCAVIGRPNVGKSTLLNALIGEKLSIISDRPQTTRNKIQIIYTDENMQVVFLDTPGVQTPINSLGETMLVYSKESLKEADCIFMLFDCGPKGGRLDSQVLALLDEIRDIPVVAILNKMDEVDEKTWKNRVEEYRREHHFYDVIPISAKEGRNLGVLKGTLFTLLPPGPMYYPSDMITDRSERFLVSEIIREKCLHLLRQEIPHGIFVGIDQMKEGENKDSYDIHATVFVEQKSHKGMVIGKGGAMLKKIGTLARKDIEKLLDAKVTLHLWVKIEKDWRKKKNKLRDFGYQEG